MNATERELRISEITDTLKDLIDGTFGEINNIAIDVDYDLRRDGYMVCIKTADRMATELLTEHNTTGRGWKGRLEHLVTAMSRHMKSESHA